MDVNEVMQQLEELGNPQTKKVLLKHGAKEPFFGVKVGDLKKLVKRIKTDHQLALDLYNTGNSDAMYLAGLIAEPAKMTVEDLESWVQNAYWYMLSEYTVSWVTAESNYGLKLAREWIKSDKEHVAAAGWSAFSNLLALKNDEELDLNEVSSLLDFVEKNIHHSPNRVKFAMNNFVINVGSYIKSLVDKAKKIAERIGKVHVEMGGTACKVPFAPTYIEKIESKGSIGVKRKTVRC